MKLKPTSFRSTDGKPALLSLPEKEAVKALRAAFEKNDDCVVLVGAHPGNGRPVEADLTRDDDVGGIIVQMRYADNEYAENIGKSTFIPVLDDVDDVSEYTEEMKNAYGKQVLEAVSSVA